MPRRDHVEGRSVIVTGGASGIGYALAEQLVRQGAHVVLADSDEQALDAAAARLDVTGRVVDVRDAAAVRSLVAEVVERFGRIDMLCNNAGISIGGPTHEISVEHWDRIIDVNLRGVVNGVAAAYPLMVEQGHGCIVNTASGAGLVAPPLVAPYATTKHAVVGLSMGLRPEARMHGVQISVLCPGAVDTPILDRLPDPSLPETASEPVTARRYLAEVRQKPISADRFARGALAKVARGKGIIIVPRSAAALWYLQRLSPTAVDRMLGVMAKHVQRTLVRPRR